MYTTSDDFKTVINNPSRKFECKVMCGSKTYTNVNIVSINVTGSLQPSGYTIGSAISHKATFKFINDGNVTFSSNTIELQIGLLVNGAYEYIPIGKYTIDSHDSDDYTITITAYDNMTKFENKYNGSATTLRAITQEICTSCGVTLGSTIPTTTVTTPTSGKYTNREVIGYIAGCMCGNAVIDRTGQLKIQKLNLSNIDKQVTIDNWFTYKNADNKFDIDEIICDTGNKDKLTSGSTDDTEKQLTIKNPLMTQAMLDSVFTELIHTVFYGFNVKYQGDISTDLGDTVKITDRKGQTLTAPLLQRTLNYNGGLTENIKTEGKKKVDLASSYYANGRYGLDFDKFNYDMQDFKYQMQDFNQNMSDMQASITDLQKKIKELEETDTRYMSEYVINTALATGNIGLTVTFAPEKVGESLKDWGDGTVDSNVTHTYAQHGIYTIKTNSLNIINLTSSWVKPTLLEIVRLNEKVTEIIAGNFNNCANLTRIGDILGVKNATSAFKNCTSLKHPANIRDLKYADNMYDNCTNLEDTGTFSYEIVSAECMFYGCSKLEYSGDMNDKITDAKSMYANCTNLKVIGHISGNLVNASNMFGGCTALYECQLTLPNSIENTSNMFAITGVSLTVNLPTALKNAEGMFLENNSSDKLITITNDIYDCVYLQNCTRMFKYCNLKADNFTKLPDTVTTAEGMCMCCNLSSLPVDFIQSSDTEINAEQMFYKSTGLEAMNVPNNVINTNCMFANSEIETVSEYNGNASMASMYGACLNITSIPQSFIDKMIADPNGTNSKGDNCFTGCINIISPETYSTLKNKYPYWF